MSILTEDYDEVESDSRDSDDNISPTQDTCCVYLHPRENIILIDHVQMQMCASVVTNFLLFDSHIYCTIITTTGQWRRQGGPG